MRIAPELFRPDSTLATGRYRILWQLSRQCSRKNFIGQLRPAASIEFSRGCPWGCVFCSAWTFYGRNYRVKTPERAVEELARVREPGIFIVDDVAFIQAEHGMQLGEAIARRGI